MSPSPSPLRVGAETWREAEILCHLWVGGHFQWDLAWHVGLWDLLCFSVIFAIGVMTNHIRLSARQRGLGGRVLAFGTENGLILSREHLRAACQRALE